MSKLKHNPAGDIVKTDAAVQGSPEWLAQRRKRIGGSEIASVVGISPYKSTVELWEEKTGRREPPDISHLPHVQRGIQAEPIARRLLEKRTGIQFKPQVWTHNAFEFMGASDDGMSVGDPVDGDFEYAWRWGYRPDGVSDRLVTKHKRIICEIKAMGAKAHQDACIGIVPPYYMVQCQWNMWMSGADLCLFVSYRPEDDDMAVVPVERWPDAHLFGIENNVYDFWKNYVQADVRPKEKPVTMPKPTSELYTLADDYMKASATLKKLEAAVESLKKDLIQKFQDVNDGAKEGGVRTPRGTIHISQVERKGNVDYAKIPELKGVDLEKYRKASTTYMKLDIQEGETK